MKLDPWLDFVLRLDLYLAVLTHFLELLFFLVGGLALSVLIWELHRAGRP